MEESRSKSVSYNNELTNKRKIKSLVLREIDMIKYTLSLGLILLFAFCKEKQTTVENTEKKENLQIVVLVAVGDVTASGKKIKANDIVQENELIKIGKKSFADLQVLNQEITFRAKEQTEITLRNILNSEKTEVAANVKVGSAMFNSGKLKQNSGLNVITPTVVMAVRGTKFETNVSQNGKTETFVLEGKVATRVNIPELESLTEEDIKKSKTISDLKNTINSKELILEAGQGTVCDSNYPKQIVKDLGLEKSIQNLNSNTIADIDKNVNQDELSKKVSNQKEMLKLNTLSTSEVSKKLKDYEELLAAELSSQNTEERNQKITERNSKINERILKRISEVIGKDPEVLVLKTGEKIKGVVIMDGGKYYVLTPTGKKEYSEEEVENVEF